MASLLHSTKVILFLGLIGILTHTVTSHTYLSSIYLNNAALPDGDCVRPHPATGFDSPISLVTSADMTCGFLPAANNPANRRCPIAAGATIGLQWHHQSSAPSDDIVDPSHVGPIIVYLAKSNTGAGNVWFKIYEDGYANGKWAVDRLLANGGRVDVRIPSDIAPGSYLLRGELIALHGAYAVNGVQPYVGCVELTISGSGTANPAGVAFPGYYTNQDPGMLFDLYKPYTSYPIPGPALYRGGSSSSSSGTPTSAPTSAPTTRPSSAPTTRPTNGPTSAPTSAPTIPPNPNPSGNIKLQLNGGSSSWWLGIIVTGGSETTTKVEITDTGSVTTWTALNNLGWAWVFDRSIELKLPISVRLTSSSGKQLTLSSVITAFNTAVLDTGKNYGSGSGSTSAPTNAPTNRPSPRPVGDAPTQVTVHQSANEWWFAVTVDGNVENIASVELKDQSLNNYVFMQSNDWGYTYVTQGSALSLPLSVRVTSESGKSGIATITQITPNMAFPTNAQL